MNTIDFSKPVRFKNPQPGEEDLTFIITNYNDVSNRCYIKAIDLPGFSNLLPEELVSVEDIVNVD